MFSSQWRRKGRPPRGARHRSEAATYAQAIKDKTTGRRTRSRAAPAKPKAREAKAAQSEPQTPPATPKAPAAPAPSASASELDRLRGELQRVNHDLSRIGRVTRPGVDPMRQTYLPEKQRLQSEKLDLERKIRTLSRS